MPRRDWTLTLASLYFSALIYETRCVVHNILSRTWETHSIAHGTFQLWCVLPQFQIGVHLPHKPFGMFIVNNISSEQRKCFFAWHYGPFSQTICGTKEIIRTIWHTTKRGKRFRSIKFTMPIFVCRWHIMQTLNGKVTTWSTCIGLINTCKREFNAKFEALKKIVYHVFDSISLLQAKKMLHYN